MAEARGSEYQSVLRIVEGFLVNVSELTNENKERLSELGELAEIVASIKNEKGDVEGTPGVQKCIALLGEVSNVLLFGSYTELLSKLSDIHSMTNEMENKQREDKSFALPQAMQARIDAVKQYLERAKKRLEEIDNTLSDLVKKVRMASDKQFQISDNEIKKLKMDAGDVDSALHACKTYLDQAENEINMLESDIHKEMKSFGIKTAAVASGIGAGLMIGGAPLWGAAAAAVTGTIAFTGWWKDSTFLKKIYYSDLLLIFRNHSRLKEELERDRMKLRSKDIHSNHRV